MRDSDRFLLDGLALVTDLREDEWALVVRDVEGAGGVREVNGQARIEIERAVAKARTLVAKHPGHADQSVHGGGRGRGISAPASSAGGASSPKAQERANIKADEAGKESAKRMVEASNTATRSFDRSNIKRGDDDDMAIMEFHDEVGRIIETAHELPAGHARAKREINKMDSWVQESVMIALRMTPKNKKVAIDSLRSITSEIKSLSQKVDEAWSGVTDMFAD